MRCLFLTVCHFHARTLWVICEDGDSRGEKTLMKIYKLHLNIDAPTYLRADRIEETECRYQFYRRGSLIVEFPKEAVRRLAQLDSRVEEELHEPAWTLGLQPQEA